MQAAVSNVANLQGCVPSYLALHTEVPLPGVGDEGIGRGGGAGRRTAAGRNRTIIGREAIHGPGVAKTHAKRCVLAHQRCNSADPLTLIELSNTESDSSLAIAPRIPTDAEPGCDGVVVVRYQGIVHARSTVAEEGAMKSIRVLARVRAGDDDEAVAGIAARKAVVVPAQFPRSDSIVLIKRLPQEGPTETIVNRQIPPHLPAILHVELIVVPDGGWEQ